MKINSINSTYIPDEFTFGRSAVPYPEYQNSENINFGHTAVPYPEYENSYSSTIPSISKVINKISALFSPEVTQKANEIKTGINKIYGKEKTNSDFYTDLETRLLSVYA